MYFLCRLCLQGQLHCRIPYFMQHIYMSWQAYVTSQIPSGTLKVLCECMLRKEFIILRDFKISGKELVGFVVYLAIFYQRIMANNWHQSAPVWSCLYSLFQSPQKLHWVTFDPNFHWNSETWVLWVLFGRSAKKICGGIFWCLMTMVFVLDSP